METKKLLCSVCESEFWSRGNTAKYCSPKCRKAGRYRGRPAESRYKKVQKGLLLQPQSREDIVKAIIMETNG